MGLITKKNLAVVVLSFFFGACSVLENGYRNEYGHYVPKHPRFKLKDKQGVFPVMLDTTSVYKLVEMYVNGQKENFELNKVNEVFMKFYPNGRYMEFGVPIRGNSYNFNSLKEDDLNPLKAAKGYYYSPNGTNIQIEKFAYGDGQGHYVILDYMFDNTGDTLIMQDKYIKIIYKKEAIPLSWNKYKVDW